MRPPISDDPILFVTGSNLTEDPFSPFDSPWRLNSTPPILESYVSNRLWRRDWMCLITSDVEEGRRATVPRIVFTWYGDLRVSVADVGGGAAASWAFRWCASDEGPHSFLRFFLFSFFLSFFSLLLASAWFTGDDAAATPSQCLRFFRFSDIAMDGPGLGPGSARLK